MVGYSSRFTPYVGAGYSAVKGFNHYLQSANPRFGRQNSFSGGSSSRVFALKRKFGTRNSFAKRVRALSGYKHNTQTDSVVGGTMLHNNIYTSSMTTKIAQGDGNTDRDGDSVHLTALKVKGVIHSGAASNGFVYRVLVLWQGEEFNVSHTTSGLAAADIFLPNQGGGFVATGNINPKACTVLYDEVVTINSLVATTSDMKEVCFNVPINQKFDYQAAGSVNGKFKNLYFVIIGGVIGGTNNVTSVGSAFFNTDLVFQNMK